MTQAAIIIDMRLRVLRTLRRAARSHAAQAAFALANGAEGMRASFDSRRTNDSAAIDAVRMAIKSARVGHMEAEWLARHAHSAAHAPTQAP